MGQRPSGEQRRRTHAVDCRGLRTSLTVGLGRSTIYRWMAEGRFPKPVQLGGYAVAWAEEEIETWISDRLQ
ncbi:MAG: AlpA family transcriptional regulator [Alphaproteobacteria bacterium HGW-Alphaproteobacteria-13]|nr:MAG: AlpA family transcriptional regulator [Alphaproteobacteria bacterium HGW-Alphaproteobacteria-13]